MLNLHLAIKLINTVSGRNKGKKPDFVVLANRQEVVVLAVNGKSYGFRPKTVKGQVASFDVSDEDCRVICPDLSTASVTIVSDLTGFKVVIVEVRRSDCGTHPEVIIHVPQSCTGVAVNVDEKDSNSRRPAMPSILELVMGGIPRPAQSSRPRPGNSPFGFGSPFAGDTPDVDENGLNEFMDLYESLRGLAPGVGAAGRGPGGPNGHHPG